MIVSGSNDKTIKLWSSEIGQLLKTIEGHTESVNCINYSPDGKIIVSGSSDKKIKLWSCETG